MKNILKYTLFTVAFLAITSCEDYVDIKPLNEVNSENYFNSEDDYQQALIGAYDLLQSTYLNVMIGEMSSDNTLCGGENANDVVGFQEIDDMTHGVVNEQLRSVWSWMYAGINRANYIFEFKDKTDFADKNNVLGQAAFLRAYYYFELVKFFGDVPMPVDKRVQFGEETGFARTPKAQVYTQIETDLLFAMSNLPDVQADGGRVTKGAAMALLGKAYLFQDKFTESASVLEDLIGMSQYSLTADYDALFLQQNENNAESVFEIQYSNLEGAGFGCLQCSEGNVAVGFNGVRGITGPTYADGFSFNVPTQNLVDAFESGDGRYRATIFDVEAYVAEMAGQGIEVSYLTGFEHTGYFNHKYIPRQGENFQDPHLTNSTNYRSIRYSDVLLMAAEALNRGGVSDIRAQEYLNLVRQRAGLGMNVDTGNTLTDAILKERRIELAGEGHRFFDLVRTGMAASAIPGFQAGKNELFPIPLIEIELAGNTWQQNDGY